MSPDSIVVIGAGLSGLSAAIRLTNEGRQVVILEAGQDVGGCCSTTDENGFRFNNGALYGATPALLRLAFSRLNMDLGSELQLRPIAVPQLSVLDSGTRVFTTTVEESWVEGDRGTERTAQYRSELRRLYTAWKPIYRRLIHEVLPYELSMWRVLSQLWRYLPKMTGSVAGLVRKSFSDRDARAAVSAITLYTGLAPERTPVTQIIGLMALLDEGFFLPEGGMGRITEVLAERARKNGVEIRTNAKVGHIDFHNGTLSGVRLVSGEFVPAGTVIATPSALDVTANLLSPEVVPASLRKREAKAVPSHRAISIQLGVKWEGRDRPAAFAVNHVPLMEEQYCFLRPESGIPKWFSYTNPTRVLPGLAPDGLAIIEMFAPVPPGSTVQQCADQSMDIAGRYIAALQTHHEFQVVHQRVLSPSDFAHTRNLHGGALYGLSPGTKPVDFFPRYAGLDGLYLAGQTTYPGYGVPPAMLSGLHAADAVLMSFAHQRRRR
ncbi:4,4'-diapophytoene desaturase (4,4'-diaponeurosporene-forming) [Castellaniella defragrans]